MSSTTSTTTHSTSTTTLTYTITTPSEAPKSSTAHLNSQRTLSTPINVPLSKTQGLPSSSRQVETAYLSALADSIDEMKYLVMNDMSAWKDAVGRFEDLEARRAGSRPTQTNQANRMGEEEDEEDEGEDEDEDEEQE